LEAEPLSAFPVVIRLPILWGDQDAFGHVNNTVYFRWFESGRIAYLERINLAHKTAGDDLGPILAAIGCNYRRQLTYPDTVHVGTRVAKIGRTSMVIEHELWSERHRAIAADGQSTIVAFDYGANRPVPVSDAMRAAISALEGKSL
jgi:acyl-CoA thioester hydrolase